MRETYQKEKSRVKKHAMANCVAYRVSPVAHSKTALRVKSTFAMVAAPRGVPITSRLFVDDASTRTNLARSARPATSPFLAHVSLVNRALSARSMSTASLVPVARFSLVMVRLNVEIVRGG